MPLFYQHNVNGCTRLAVWHITEPEEFFLQKVFLQKEINHPHKRIQHLAGRYLLQLLNVDFPLHLIEIAASKKPLLPGEQFHFSISHCGNFAAAIISEAESAGIDVEMFSDKVEKIKNKFLTPGELALLPAPNLQFLTVFWSGKEAVYKWYGKGSVDFKNHIKITSITVKKQQGIITCSFIKKEMKKNLSINFHLFNNICLAWVLG